MTTTTISRPTLAERIEHLKEIDARPYKYTMGEMLEIITELEQRLAVASKGLGYSALFDDGLRAEDACDLAKQFPPSEAL